MRAFPAAFFTLVLTVLVGVAFALYLIFRSLKDHVDEADRVISELQRGNLKARFPAGRADEIGKAMERFNLMADEIERLMEQLRSVERSRAFLLQELTHDLRTPVASLSNLLETIFSQVKMDETIADLAELAQKETDYIARMVEDLLLLAQVSEPSYRAQQGAVDLDALIEEEGDALSLRSQGRVAFAKATTLAQALVPGDEHLLRRLFRNALENAFSFARQKVSVSLLNDRKGGLVIRIQDDGDGFSPEMLLTFGERRTKRKINTGRAGRLSLGLGSVIMKTVTTLHRGELRALNEGGAVVEIRLPAIALNGSDKDSV
jgi:signal transduction histidine kinase